MSSLDLPEIRARLAAKEKARRRPGPLRQLKALLSDDFQRPLLGRPEPPPMGPQRRPASLELDLLSAGAEPPLEAESRRNTFGRRTDGAEAGDADEPLLLVDSPPPFCEEEPLLLLDEAPSPPRQSGDALALLSRLEMRILQEQAGLLGKIALHHRALISD